MATTVDVDVEHLHSLINVDWHARYPELGAEPVPVWKYFDESYFEDEKKYVFRESWLVAGRVQQIPNPGDYFVREIKAWSTSVIVARQDDGQIRAMHNMCAHRGNTIVWDAAGSTSRFTCKYHGWSYRTSGEIATITDENSFHGIDREACALPRISVDTWGGWIFVHRDPSPKVSLREFLGELGETTENYPWNEFASIRGHWSGIVRCNWKAIRDGFIEAYHAGFIHRRILGNSTYDRYNPYSHFLDISLMERHARLSVYRSPYYRTYPVRHAVSQFPVSVEPFELPPGMNVSRSPNWHQDILMIFPNIVLDPGGGRYGGYYSHTFWPLDSETTLYELDLYHPMPTTGAQRVNIEYSRLLLRDAALEDFGNSEQAQAMLRSGAREVMFLQNQEIAIRHQLHVGDQMIAAGKASK